MADIIFLIDTSGSMGIEIADVRNNVNSFAQSLTTSEVDFRLGLVQFGNSSGPNPTIFNGGILTSDVALFQSFVDTLYANGGYEPGFLALRMAVQGFSFRPGTQKVFILISDEDSDDRDKQGTIDLLLANDVTVHTAALCSFGTSQSDYCDETSVRGVTGGLLFNVIGPYDQVLDTIASSTASTYILSYKSSNPTFDGTTRNVECTVSSGGQSDSVLWSYIPGAAPHIELTEETEALNRSALTEGSTPTIRVLVTDQVSPFVQSVTLFYRVSSSGSAYASLPMTALGGNVYEAVLPPVTHPGMDYFIRATDGQVTSSLPSNDPGQYPFQIAVLPNIAPEITHTPLTSAPLNEDLSIVAAVIDITNHLSTVEVYWRYLGRLIFDSIEMTNTGGELHQATVPANQITGDIEYYIRAVDDFGVASTYGAPDSPILVDVATVLSPGGPGKGDGCFNAIYGEAQEFEGDPIHTRTGSMSYSVEDISIETVAGRLAFEREYDSSLTDVYTQLLGFGWTHSLDSRLIFPGDPGGEESTVLFKAHSTNQYRFSLNPDGTFTPDPGLCGTLTKDDGPRLHIHSRIWPSANTSSMRQAG